MQFLAINGNEGLGCKANLDVIASRIVTIQFPLERKLLLTDRTA